MTNDDAIQLFSPDVSSFTPEEQVIKQRLCKSYKW